jgi:valine dehydrogenase (NAD+)
VGTYVADMDLVARECDYVTGRSPENGGAGDSSILTAFGVYQAMRACARSAGARPSSPGAGWASPGSARSAATCSST